MKQVDEDGGHVLCRSELGSDTLSVEIATLLDPKWYKPFENATTLPMSDWTGTPP